MRYIEIQDGLSVKKSEVESVQRADNGGSIIIMKSGREIETAFLYITFLKMLEDDSSEQTNNEELQNSKMSAFLENVGHFRG